METQNNNFARTTRRTQTQFSRRVIPVGTMGKVLDRRNGDLIIDFGLLTLIKIPVGSTLIEVIKTDEIP